MQRVIKRDGREVVFDASRIRNAIKRANDEVPEVSGKLQPNSLEFVVNLIVGKCEQMNRAIPVEEIQDMVEDALIELGKADLARRYIKYRYQHALKRQSNTIDDAVMALVSYQNENVKQENSNKNPEIIPTQRDYIAGEVSKDLTRRKLLPDDVLKAHDEGVIHFHDADYFIQPSHNCFSGDTLFKTAEGDKRFDEFKDLDLVDVFDKNGERKVAVVRCFGMQRMQKVTFRLIDTEKVVICTPDHRWLLEDGSETTDLRVGNVLGWCAPWRVVKIEPDHKKTRKAWCVVEPVTHSFTLADDMVTGNCDLVNLEDMLQNGTVISGTLIEKPHSFSTACNIATQIIAQVASCQYGGQTITLAHLAPFVQETRVKLLAEHAHLVEHLGEAAYRAFIEKLVEEDIRRGVQTIQYQVVTLMTTNGQAPFITVYMDINEVEPGQTRQDLAKIIEEVLRQRFEGVKNEQGVWITPAFPKLIYALDENNTAPNTEFWYLTKLAAKCSARRMVPDYISRKKMREYKQGDTYPCMGCRSFLTPDTFTDRGIGNISNAKNYVPGKHRYYGRFNQGVVTLNLVDVALSSGGDMEKFWEILEDRLELCHRALRLRHDHLKGTVSDVAPILWQYGALARLKKGDTIDELLYNGYSTISLGYAGLYECVKYMTGKSHTDEEEGMPFGLSVMQKLNDACAKWKAAEHIDYSVYGTPIESVTYKFAKCLQQRFGIIPEVTDHNYITNSYHINVREPIDAYSKLRIEAKFQKLSPGGAVSYVEVPNMQDNLEAVLDVIRYIYDNIMYAEINTKSDYCQVCGYDGEIRTVPDDSGKLIWECPNCGNADQHKLNVARRTCGYIGTNFWNAGRTEEIRDRVLHL